MREKICKSGVNLLGLALTISLVPIPGWAANPTNTVQDGRVVPGGTYYNTANNRTTFQNTSSGGLWVRGNSTVRGVELDANGNPTNNGGTLHFYAPGSVVRVDGNIDVSALRNNQGAALGNGGKVFIDSDYLFQSGNIFANGQQGGLVQINVAGATLAPGASIQAKGEGGNGGVVAINSSGLVDIQKQALIDTSGRVSANFDTNLINIEGGLVNIEGIIRADGVAPQFGGSRGGTIRLVSNGGMADTDFDPSPQSQALQAQNMNVIQHAWNNATQRPAGDTAPATLQTADIQNLQNRSDLLTGSYFGSINIGGAVSQSIFPILSANGTRGGIESRNDYVSDTTNRAGDGGTILLISSKQLFNNYGSIIRANGATGLPGDKPGLSPVQGGNGGTIAMFTRQILFNSAATIEANGGRGGWSNQGKGADSGDGGLIALSYGGIQGNYFENHGRVTANGALGGDGLTPGRGGNGGLIVIDASQNPMDSPYGGYPLVQANAGRGGNDGGRLLGGSSGVIVSPTPSTLGQNGRYEQFGYANGKTIEKPLTESTQPIELLSHAENLLLITNNTGGGNIPANLYARMNQAKIRSVEDPTGSLGLARNEVIEKNTDTSPYVFRNLLIGSQKTGLSLDLTPAYQYNGNTASFISPFPLSRGIGLNTLNTVSILNEGAVNTLWVNSNPPGNAPAPQFDLWVMGKKPGNLGGGRISVLATGNIQVTNQLGAMGAGSGGSILLASGNDINIGLNSTEGHLFTQGGLHGGSIILKAPHNIGYNATAYYSPSEIKANGSLLGGRIQLWAGNQLKSQNNLRILANGGLQGGSILIQSPDTTSLPTAIEAKGSERNGRITVNGQAH